MASFLLTYQLPTAIPRTVISNDYFTTGTEKTEIARSHKISASQLMYFNWITKLKELMYFNRITKIRKVKEYDLGISSSLRENGGE